MNKNNILFLNFDKFNNDKVSFFNNVEKIIRKKNYSFFFLSTIKIDNAEFKSKVFNFESVKIKNNFNHFLKKIGITKKIINDWILVLSIFLKKSKTSIYLIIISTIIEAIKNIIKIKPVCVIIWTEYFPLVQIYKIICKYFNIPYLIAERGLLNGTLMIEKNGIYGKSHLTEKNISEVKKKFSNKYIYNYLNFFENSKPLWEQPINSKNINLIKSIDKKKIFFAGTNEIWHGFYPYVNKETSPVFKSHLLALKYLSKIVKKYNNIELIFKPHPRDRVFPLVAELVPKNVMIVNEDARQLIKECDIFITISSSLACDALIMAKPVILLGKFDLSGKNCCYEIKKKEDIDKLIYLFSNNRLNNNHQYNWNVFFNYLLNYYLFDLTNKNICKKKYKEFSEELLYFINKKSFNFEELNQKKIAFCKNILKNVSLKKDIVNILKVIKYRIFN